MTFTPSATSSFSAGAVFWGLVWATLGKLNELVHFVGFKKANPRQTVLRWINPKFHAVPKSILLIR